MIQLILHLLGDFVLQSHWMAENKGKNTFAAAVHAIAYSLPFLLLQPSWTAFSMILGTHFLIDRFRLARFVVWAKNQFYVNNGPDFWEQKVRMRWSNCSATGYPADVPPWLAVWLLIAADNTLHLLCNYTALRWL